MLIDMGICGCDPSKKGNWQSKLRYSAVGKMCLLGIRSSAGKGADGFVDLEVHEEFVSSKKKTPRARKESSHTSMPF